MTPRTSVYEAKRVPRRCDPRFPTQGQLLRLNLIIASRGTRARRRLTATQITHCLMIKNKQGPGVDSSIIMYRYERNARRSRNPRGTPYAAAEFYHRGSRNGERFARVRRCVLHVQYHPQSGEFSTHLVRSLRAQPRVSSIPEKFTRRVFPRAFSGRRSEQLPGHSSRGAVWSIDFQTGPELYREH